ncbi:hypothetical protein ONA91_18595 [Micromonospora sp. DR5-3]|uniref:XRE family transcriptional regulator n=1 Tax=unclassified Micromonospora TaxID=2617518 RepID=UPI0011D93087|nr:MULTISPECIES: XRE family transcriptional regulator [unclassified Micromonospora]MCW3816459.1 hypothetical protein [Micromonospora sp. DR5-3]TYC21249.1 hypothetical protein FXF52_27050 [Micromonospora sp. MP36]
MEDHALDDGQTPKESNGAEEVHPGGGSAPDPFSAASPAEFVAAMRALKEWSGLTFRQLQRQAEAVGEVLPHSTIASVLGRNNLPREALVTAFVRACGLDQATAASWLATRKRLAAEAAREAVPAAPVGNSEPGPAAGRQADLPPGPAPDTAVPEQHVPDETAERPDPRPEAERLPVLEAVLESVLLSEASGLSAAGGTRPEPSAAQPASSGRTEPRSGGQEPALPASAGRLANVAAERTDERWVGMHRHDPAEDVPRPAGFRWLIPPIMYRTGWASRVLSGVLVLVMATIAVAVIARALRDSPETAADSGSKAELPVDEPETLPAAVPSVAVSPSASPSRSAAPRPRPSTGGPSPTKAATGGPAAGPAVGPVRLRVAHTGLCVGEGPELYKPSGRIVLGQHSCASAAPPIILERVSGNVYRIKLDHPQYGIGCATIDYGGRGDGVLLTGDDCSSGRADQTFTFEPLTGPAGGYRVRSVPGKDYCIGVYGEHRDVGAQLIQTPCTGSLAQTFTVQRR